MSPSKRLNHMAQTWTIGPESVNHVLASTAIARAHRIANRQTDRIIAGLGLSSARYEILVALFFNEQQQALSLTQLSKGLSVHPATLTYTIDQLADAGLVVRTPHPTDRRVVLAQLTPAGRALTEKANAALSEIQFGVGALTDREAVTITQILGKISYDG